MIEFVVPGTPVGKGRPKFARRGKFVHTYTPEKTASYENLVKLYANQAMAGKLIMEGAVSISITLCVHPPESWSEKKKKRALNGEIHLTSKPDADNSVKLLMDAMNEIVYKDDKQVVELYVIKYYSHISGTHVFVKEFEGKFSNLF